MTRLPVFIVMVLLVLVGCVRRDTIELQSNYSLQSLDFQTRAELLPVADELNRTTAEQLKALHASECIWKSSLEEIQLSWSCTARITATDNSETIVADACTRIAQRSDGSDIVFPPWRTAAPDGHLSVCSSTEPTRFNHCSIDGTACRRIRQPCAGDMLNSNFPYCQPRCKIGGFFGGTSPVVNGRYTIQLDAPLNFNAPISPAFHEVQDATFLSRPLLFDPGRSNVDAQLFHWTFTVPSSVAGRWLENFSPTLRIIKVRAFSEDPRLPHDRRYFQINRVFVNGRPLGGAEGARPCGRSPEDPTEITADTCPDLFALNPAYAAPQFQDKLLWGFELLARPDVPVNTGLTPRTILFIEFEVQSGVGNRNMPWMTPSTVQFGGIAGGAPRDVLRAARILAELSPEHWTVQELRVRGPDATRFTNIRAEGRTPPFELWPGGSVSVSFRFSPGTAGRQRATLEVPMQSQTGKMLTLTTQLEAEVVAGYSLDVIPSTLIINQNVVRERTFPWRKSVLISNGGVASVERGQLRITGPDAGSFQILTLGQTTTPPVSSTLNPGDAEVISIAYCPRNAGRHRAELKVETVGVGESTVILDAVVPAGLQYCPP